MLKDVYNCGQLRESARGQLIPHSIKCVYAVWIMRSLEESQSFINEFRECQVWPTADSHVLVELALNTAPASLRRRPQMPPRAFCPS